MKRVNLIILYLSFFTLLTSEESPNLYKGGNLDIYILIGQSNMAGRAEINEHQLKPMKNIYLLNQNNSFEVAKNPLNKHSSIRKDLNLQKLGPGYSFAQEMLKDAKRPIGLIVNARGASSINDWKKDSKYYLELIERIKSSNQFGKIKGILWHQGEQDHKDLEYTKKLLEFINDLRSDLTNTSLPFIAGEINNQPLFNEALNKLPTKVKSMDVVSSRDLKTTDDWHFDNKSQILLGQRYAIALKKIMKKK